MAVPFTQNGVTVVAVGYDLAPQGMIFVYKNHKLLIARGPEMKE